MQRAPATAAGLAIAAHELVLRPILVTKGFKAICTETIGFQNMQVDIRCKLMLVVRVRFPSS